MLAPKSSNTMKNFEVIQRFGFLSDHRPIKCEILLVNWWRATPKSKPLIRINQSNKVQYKVELNNLLKESALQDSKDMNCDELNKSLITIISKATESTLAGYQTNETSEIKLGLSVELKSLISKRDELRYKKN